MSFPTGQHPAEEIARAAKTAFESSQLIPVVERINALNQIKKELDANKAEILAANREDLQVHTVYTMLIPYRVDPLSGSPD